MRKTTTKTTLRSQALKNHQYQEASRCGLTEAVFCLDRLGWVGWFTRTCLVDSPDPELVLVTLLQVRDGALQHVSLDLVAHGPIGESVLMEGMR